jgi:segregation and condensation protein A
MDLFSESQKPQDKILSLLFNEDELTWQNIIYDLVRNEGMDPWDIDVSEIAHKFLEMLKKLRDMDFRISGKVVLAAALLLKIKSNLLIDEDITALDILISSADEPESLLDELPAAESSSKNSRGSNPKLMPKTPQPRKRKVSVQDLIEALEKALEVQNRRPPVYKQPRVNLLIPKKHLDVGEMINDVYLKVQDYYSKSDSTLALTFTQLVASDSKEDKVFTFIPLLHLDNQRKVDMVQKAHFGEIGIVIPQATPTEVYIAPTTALKPEGKGLSKSKRT